MFRGKFAIRAFLALLALAAGATAQAQSGFEEVCFDALHGGLNKAQWDAYQAALKAQQECLKTNPPAKCPAPTRQGPTSKAGLDNLSMKAKYCSTYQMAEHKKAANKTLSMLWSAATAGCGVACFCKVCPPVACYVPAGIATAADIMESQNVSGLLQGAMGGMSGGGLAYMAGDKLGKAKDKNTCLAMAFSFSQVMGKQQESQNASSEAKSALDSARQLNDSQSTAAVAIDGGDPSGAQRGPAEAIAFPSGSHNVNDPCSAGGNSQASIACALAEDSKLKEFLKANNVEKQFAQATGKSLADFLQNGDASAKGIASAMAGALGNQQAGAIGAALAQAQSEYKGGGSTPEVASTSGTYKGGGGGAGATAKGGEESDPMAEMLKKLLDGDGGAAGTDPKMKAVEFAIRKDGPSQLVNNRSISLFDRTTRQYRLIDRQWSGVGAARAPASVEHAPHAAQ